ncbi:MAG: 50S ribosomal protein L30 [Saccharofermentans sp.]|jgi:large subunit ribosomal protein L30|nr:50S ribosomal protein L30 [Mageeibacillus sp.]MCI1264472.1 50S ribosomal protein L30 [Saccharofermentans sp.]MCI1275545.1 50S ribosomal protein L30 [Saccharofermentans sp.]MCI1768835.1 50S ribosomal protein L30 [Mageeibacillus sp.]
MANLKITLVKSTNKARSKETATITALGLRKIGQSVEKADNEAIRGMLKVVSHYVAFEEI